MNISHLDFCSVIYVSAFLSIHPPPTDSCEESEGVEEAPGEAPLLGAGARQRHGAGVAGAGHDLGGQLGAQRALEAEQLLGGVVRPVEGVQDVHLLGHLPQLGHGVAAQLVQVAVHLAAQRGQHLVTGHHGGAARARPRQLPRLHGREDDGAEQRVAEHRQAEAQRADGQHGARPARRLALVGPPRQPLAARRHAAPGLGRGPGLHQVLAGEDGGGEAGCLCAQLQPGLQLALLGHALLAAAAEGLLAVTSAGLQTVAGLGARAVQLAPAGTR